MYKSGSRTTLGYGDQLVTVFNEFSAWQTQHDRNRFQVRIWLYGLCLLVFAMVIVGGATRLTDSGLSITEWQPILGVIPPMNDWDWLEAFDKYQQIPEYQEINKNMSPNE